MTETFTDHAAIHSVLGDVVRRDPVRHTLFGTLGAQLGDGAWAAVDGPAVAARSTSGWPVVVSADWTDARVLRELPGLRGVSGPVGTVEPLVGALAAHRTVHRDRQALYRLDELTPPTAVPGAGARAQAPARGLVRQWLAEFAAETGDAKPRDLDATAPRLIADGTWLWHGPAGDAVAMAARRPVVAGSARVGPVYTTPGERGHGYGSAVTAMATESVLRDGGVPVLFTDLANPTSNKIYRLLGYRRVEDRVVVTFG